MPYLEIDDARIYYEVHGAQGPAVLLVHGAMCSHHDWDNQVRQLRDGCTVVTLDLRGHGRSAAPFATCTIERFGADLNALIRALGLGPAVLAGHSLATRVVIEAARQAPPNVSGLVLVDGSRVYPSRQSPASDPARQTDLEVRARIADLIEAAIGPYADPATASHIRRTMSSAPVGLQRAYLVTAEDWDAHSFDAALNCLPPGLPALAIQSTRVGYGIPRSSLTADTTTTPYLDELRGHRPALRSVILPETGHFSMLEAADQVSGLIDSFARLHGRPPSTVPSDGPVPAV